MSESTQARVNLDRLFVTVIGRIAKLESFPVLLLVNMKHREK